MKKIILSLVFFCSWGWSKDTAIFLSLECEPTSMFGHVLENAKNMFEQFNWNTVTLCGEGLNLDDLFRTLRTLEVEEDDHVWVDVHSHGTKESLMDHQVMTFNMGYPLEEKEDLERFLLGFSYVSTNDIFVLLKGFQKNRKGKMFVNYNNCFAGMCIPLALDIPNTCAVAVSAAENYGKICNFMDLAYFSLSPKRASFEFCAKQYQTVKDIKPKSTKLKDILSVYLAHDVRTKSFNSHGFGLDELNMEESQVFAQEALKIVHQMNSAKQTFLSVRLAELKTLGKEKESMGQAWCKNINLPSKKDRLQALIDEKDGELTIIRNQVTSALIEQSQTDCANFDLDRR